MDYYEILYQYSFFTKVMKMNDNGDYDLDNKQLNAEIDLQSCWHHSELPSLKLFNLLLESKIEFKNMEEARKCYFIEYYITPDIKNPEITEKSGLSISKSEFYVLTTKVNMHIITTDMLKWILKYKENLNIKDEDGDHKKYPRKNPHGLIIPHERLLELENEYIKSENARKIIHQRFVKKK